jgi:glutamyl-tRNA synthetase
MAREVRVRFAPSPTGGLHIGGVRTALYNYLYARNHGGKFVLRIEDTDQARKVDGAEEYIIEALKWCGIEPDEGPNIGGNYSPYRQSERLAIYRDHVNQLLASGNAYYAFDTPEELTTMRERLQKEKAAIQQYGISTRIGMRNSITLGSEEAEKLIAAGIAYVVRIKVPENQTIIVDDIIRGRVEVDSATIDDKILLKSDGFPTYHLANVVDDHLMEISHVIRGEEWLPSAPLHVLLYQLFGWRATMPEFAHLPLILKPEGSGKLSKRDAEKHGFSIFPIAWHDPATGETIDGFREQGYIPEALVNFLALLGWNPGTEEEEFDLARLAEIFDLKRINRAGAKFDVEKAKWFNQLYLRKQPGNLLADEFKRVVEQKGYACSDEKINDIIALLMERVVFFSDFWNQAELFFVKPLEYDEQMARKKWSNEVSEVLATFTKKLTDSIAASTEETKQLLWEAANEQGLGIGKVMPSLRLALVGYNGGPDLMNIIKILGAKETSERIQEAFLALN